MRFNTILMGALLGKRRGIRSTTNLEGDTMRRPDLEGEAVLTVHGHEQETGLRRKNIGDVKYTLCATRH